MVMRFWKGSRTRRLFAAAALALGLATRPAPAGDHLPATVPEPLGTAVHRFFDIQASLAYADHFVLYECEWVGLTDKLGPYGYFHLHEILRRLPGTRLGVLIQVNLDKTVNEARRRRVVEALAEAGFADANERVFVGFPGAEGLYGDEAVQLYPPFIAIRARGAFGAAGSFGGLNGLNGGLGGFFGGLNGLGGLGGLGGGLGGLYGGLGGGYGGYGAPPGTVQGYRGLGY